MSTSDEVQSKRNAYAQTEAMQARDKEWAAIKQHPRYAQGGSKTSADPWDGLPPGGVHASSDFKGIAGTTNTPRTFADCTPAETEKLVNKFSSNTDTNTPRTDDDPGGNLPNVVAARHNTV